MNIFDEQKKACSFIEKTIKENKKISHAYLIETNDYYNYNNFIKYLIKSILCLNSNNSEYNKKIEIEVEHNNYPDVKYIYPDGNNIKKEQLLSLEKEFSKKSMLDNKLIYVIDQAEKLNDSSANTILKFLEEPEEDIIAILVANNRYKVLDTILSRCQVITLINNDFGVNIDENIINFFNDLIITKKMIINYDLYLETLFIDKKTSIDTLNNIELILYNYLNNYEIDDELIRILKDCDNDKIIRWILLIDREKNKLDYNLNIKLWLLNLVTVLMEV